MSICAVSEANDYSVLQEIKCISTGANNYKIRGHSILQTLDEVNGNRRVYTRAIGEQYVQSANDKIKKGLLLGEMDHPFIKNPKDPSEIRRQTLVLWENVSHKFNEMHIEGNRICGLVETLSNHKGVDLARMANLDGLPIGFSLRAIGQVKPKNFNGQSIMEVVQPSIFVTFDAVVDPSHASAKLQDITEVITTDNGGINKFRGITESDESAVLSEWNSLLDLREVFKSCINNSNKEPVKSLLETFFDSRLDGTMSSINEEKYVHGKMNSLLSEYLSSSDKDTGVSSYQTLNESNVHDLMQHYSHNYKENSYSTLKGARGLLNKFLG